MKIIIEQKKHSWLATAQDAPRTYQGLLVHGSTMEEVLDQISGCLSDLRRASLIMFKEGDRVHHIGRKEDGTVLQFTSTGMVRVEFDKPTPSGHPNIGEFDEFWFKTHPGWLLPLQQTPGA